MTRSTSILDASPRTMISALAWPAVALAVFASAWGGNEFTPLLVMYRQTGDFSPVVVDVLLFTYVLGIVPALLIGGPLSDRLGRRPLMLPAPLCAAAGSLLLLLGAHSVAMLSVGRVLSGVALGLSMAVGGTWITELSISEDAGPAVGARRGALSLTAGFGVGAGLAGVLAEWAPWPHVLAYLVNIVLALVALVLLARVPDTRPRPPAGEIRRLAEDLKVPAARNPRFLLVVLPVAPWVFGACAIAYAVIPDLMSDKTSGWPIAFAALCCVVGLAAGFAIQSVGRRIDRPGTARGAVVALLVLAVGMVLAALAATMLTIWLALVAAAVLGCGYGMAMIAGLLEVQRIAARKHLAGLSAVFYSVTYLGFIVPAVLAWISQTWTSITYTEMFGAGVVATVLCLACVLIGNARYPGARRAPARSDHG